MDLSSGKKRNFNEMIDESSTYVDHTKTLNVLRSSNHDFSFTLYKEISKKETGNIFYSPFSIHIVMFMASVGASSKTFDEIIATLHLNKTYHSLEAYKILLEKIISKNDNIKLATGMFVDTTFNVKDNFIEMCMKYLKSSIEKLDFKNDPEKQCQYINNWVLNQTDNKITDLYTEGSINSNTTLTIANALHFKCPWHYEFFNTSEESFYVTSTKKVTVKMMNLCNELNYYHDEELKFSALKLPYLYNAYDMLILLPDDEDGLQNLEDNFSKINLHEISSKLNNIHDVSVKLPRFKIEQSLQLKEVLSSLGCPTMFTDEANFSKIVDDKDLLVSNVVHKAYVDVNEKGTEAAAATSCRYKYMSAIIGKQTANFFADHPFIFSIMSPTKDILFMGRLFEP